MSNPTPLDGEDELRKQVQRIVKEPSLYPTCKGYKALTPMSDEIMQLIHTFVSTKEREAETKYIDVLAKAQLNMRPLIALKNGNGEVDNNWYVMYWDDDGNVWNRARYGDILKEVRLAHLNAKEKDV